MSTTSRPFVSIVHRALRSLAFLVPLLIASLPKAAAGQEEETGALVRRARAARAQRDSTIGAYRALVRQRVQVAVAIGDGPALPRRLVYARDDAQRISWSRDGGLRVDVLGRRVTSATLPYVRQELAKAVDELLGEMSLVPYSPGQEPLWFGGVVAHTAAGASEIVNPLAEDADPWYSIVLGDKATIRMGATDSIRLRELRVLPRRLGDDVIIGSVWIDEATARPVRAVYRPSMDIDNAAVAARLNGRPSRRSAVGRVFEPNVTRVTAMTVEYALYAGRVWLPHLRTLEGSVQRGAVRLPFLVQQTFTYDGVVPLEPRNAPPANGSVATGARRGRLPPATPNDGRCDPDGMRARVVGVPSNAPAREWVIVREPCDPSALAVSSLLPLAADQADSLFHLDEQRDLARQLLAGVEGDARRPSAQAALRLDPVSPRARFNRVEGLSLGAQAGWRLSPTTGGTLTAHTGFGDRVPNVALLIATERSRFRLSGEVYSRLQDVRDTPESREQSAALAVAGSLNAAFFGVDEGFYYRAAGGKLVIEPRAGEFAMRDVRFALWGEREEDASSQARSGVDTRGLQPNIAVRTAKYEGVTVAYRAVHGLDPFTRRLEWHARGEAATGATSYVHAALGVGVMQPVGALTLSVQLSGGALAGSPPAQRLWYIGGPASVRGAMPDTAYAGTRYGVARLDLSRAWGGVAPTVFLDRGWVARTGVSATARALTGAGAGISLHDGLLRLDLARPVGIPGQWHGMLRMNVGV
ncbi:MAG: hypothetical protein JWM95_4089 [Gemmatimonadetes bacterium]|nr:hypothetical protein [Gemmatimonadota bacterium]